MHCLRRARNWRPAASASLGWSRWRDEFTPRGVPPADGGRGRPKSSRSCSIRKSWRGWATFMSDEALYRRASIPERAADSLSAAELQRLHARSWRRCAAAVEAGGSSIKSYVNGQGEMGMFQHRLKAYGRTGEPCRTCGDADRENGGRRQGDPLLPRLPKTAPRRPRCRRPPAEGHRPRGETAAGRRRTVRPLNRRRLSA